MLAADLVKLITEGERFEVEFKGEEFEPLNDRELVEAVVCLANGHGGRVLVGVEDDGRITGARPRHEAGRTDPMRLQALIAARTQPPLHVDVELATVEEREVIVITIDDSVRIVGTADGRYVRRALGGDGRPCCVPFHAHEMLAHEVDRGAVDFAGVPVREARWEDLDPLEFERLRRLIAEAGGRGDKSLVELTDLEIAKALGVVVANHEVSAVLTGALLLFGRQDALRRFVPTHEAAFQVLRGTDVEVNDFFRWPLLRLAEEFIARFRARNSEEEIQFGLVRVGVPAYSEVAFREALANALIHRDYTRLGAVHVQWDSGRLEISSPGGFPPGIRLDNLLVTPPRPRNPRLADAFKRAGIVERTGRGINRMYEQQLRYGRPAPDYTRSTDSDVVAALAGGPADLALVRYVVDRDRAQQRLSLSDLLVLTELLRERRVTTAEAAALLQVGERDARTHLASMVERGLVEARGARRGGSYHLSAGVYRALEESAAYVRVRGFEPLQQEQMVLSYVDAHGRITRSDAADLCQIDSEAARRLLRRLVAQEHLVMRGRQRGAYYERRNS